MVQKFGNFFHRKMSFFRRSSSRRRTLGESSSEGSVRQAYAEPRTDHIVMADAKSCCWPSDEFMRGAGIKEEFDHYIDNTGLTDFLADKCVQHYNLTRTFTHGFRYHPNTSRLLFNLYDKSFSMTLEEFSDACKLPIWGSIEKPKTTDYNMFLECICVGEDRGVTHARIEEL